MNFSQKKFIIFLVVLSIVVATFFSLMFWDLEPKGDGLHYAALGQSLAESGRFAENGVLNSRRDPGYPFFLAGIYKIFGFNQNAVYIIQVFLFACIGLVSYYLARFLLGSEKLARLSGMMVALCYPLAMHAGIIFSEILFTFLFLLSSYFLLLAARKHNLWILSGAGIFLGLATLTRSFIFYLPILLAFAIAFQSRKSFRTALIAALMFLMSFGLVVAPWIARNYYHFKTAEISTQSGPTLFFAVQRMKIDNIDLPKVFIANILGDFYTQKIFGEYNRYEIEEGNFGKQLTELENTDLNQQEINELVRNIALQEIKQNPLRYVITVLPIEFLKLHTPIFPLNSAQGLFSDPERYLYLPGYIKGVIVLVVRLLYWIFLGIVVYAIFKTRKEWQKWIWIYLLLVYPVGIYSLLHGIPRYLLPVIPLYIILFVYGGHDLLKKFNNEQ